MENTPKYNEVYVKNWVKVPFFLLTYTVLATCQILEKE